MSEPPLPIEAENKPKPKPTSQRFLDDCLGWLSRNGTGFSVGVVGGFLSGLLVWWVQDYSTKSEAATAQARIIESVKLSAKSECDRVQKRFATFYDGYPTIYDCKINVYRLLPPDKALISYIGDRREAILDAMGGAGLSLVRDSKLSSDAYDRIFSGKYFDAMIWKDTTTFQDYFGPLVSMCKAVDVKLEIQHCPWE